MRNTYRPIGRFFCLLRWTAIVWALSISAAAQTGGPAMTKVKDNVYRADGSPAAGTVLISWPAFTTADGKAVAAGTLSVQLGTGGAFLASLAPNTGAQPAGVYYKVVYQLADDSVQASWEGEYRVASECLVSSDVLPGDKVTVNAPSRGANFSAIAREVRVEVVSLAYERANFAIRFANDAAEPLAYEVSKTTIPGPLPLPYTSTSGSSVTFLPSLTAVQVTDIIATQITVDAGVAPPAGGGIEVRRSDGGWGASGDGNLVGRYTTQSFVLPRLSRIQEYAVRQYDGSNPPRYSRHSALVHVNYPW